MRRLKKLFFFLASAPVLTMFLFDFCFVLLLFFLFLEVPFTPPFLFLASNPIGIYAKSWKLILPPPTLVSPNPHPLSCSFFVLARIIVKESLK